MLRSTSISTLPPEWFAKRFLLGFSYPVFEVYFRDATDRRVSADKIAWPIGRRGGLLFVEVYDPEHRTTAIHAVSAENGRFEFDQLMIKLGVGLSGCYEDRYRDEFFCAAGKLRRPYYERVVVCRPTLHHYLVA